MTEIDEYESHGFTVRKCFPDSFKPLWSLEESGNPQADEAAWENYNLALEAGTPPGFSVLLFPGQLAYEEAYKKDPQLGQHTRVLNPDGSVSVWFLYSGSSNCYIKPLQARLLCHNYMVPVPPSVVGDEACVWLHKALPLKPYTPDLSDVQYLTGREFSLHAIPLRGMMAFGPPDQPGYIGGGLLDAQGKMLIAGSPKIGKSRLALNMAFCMVTGRPFLNIPAMGYPRIMFLQFEVSERRFRERINSIARAWKIPSDNDLPLYFLTLPSLRLDKRAGVHDLRRLLKMFKADVLFLDPMAKIHTGDEREQSEMQQLLDTLDELIDELSISVVLVHHVNKAVDAESWARIRGSSYIPGWADSILLLGQASHDAKPYVQSILRNGEDWVRTIEFQSDHTIRIIGNMQDALEDEIFNLVYTEPHLNRKEIAQKVSRKYQVDVSEVYGVMKRIEAGGHTLPS